MGKTSDKFGFTIQVGDFCLYENLDANDLCRIESIDSDMVTDIILAKFIDGISVHKPWQSLRKIHFSAIEMDALKLVGLDLGLAKELYEKNHKI